MLGFLHKVCNRYLVSTECTFDGQAINNLRASPPFKSTEYNHGPLRAFLNPLFRALVCMSLISATMYREWPPRVDEVCRDRLPQQNMACSHNREIAGPILRD